MRAAFSGISNSWGSSVLLAPAWAFSLPAASFARPRVLGEVGRSNGFLCSTLQGTGARPLGRQRVGDDGACERVDDERPVQHVAVVMGDERLFSPRVRFDHLREEGRRDGVAGGS